MFKYSIHEVVIGGCVNQEPLDRVPQNLFHKLCENTKFFLDWVHLSIKNLDFQEKLGF